MIARVFGRRTSRFAGFVTAMIATVGVGCAPGSSPAVRTSVHAVRMLEVSAPSASSSVQAMPEYAKARSACSAGKYQLAAEILAGLEKSSRLNEEERSFVQAQQQICLGHLAFHASSASKSVRVLGHSSAQATDCGPRALLIACDKLGVKTSLAMLTKAAGTGPKGTSLQGLKRAAQSVHLKADGVQVSREALPDQVVPSIAWFHGDHYVTLLALNGRGESGTALIHDPNEAAPKTVSQESLLQSSSGVLLTLHR